MASRVFGVRTAVVGDRPYWFGTHGDTWTIRFDARLEHYDVVVPMNNDSKTTDSLGI